MKHDTVVLLRHSDVAGVLCFHTLPRIPTPPNHKKITYSLAYIEEKAVPLRSIRLNMGQLAFIKAFVLVAIPLDANDNRRHVHVFRKGGRHLRSVAKIWIEKGGEKCIEIAESELSAKDNKLLVDVIDRHWDILNEQITKTFRGEKPQPKNIK